MPSIITPPLALKKGHENSTKTHIIAATQSFASTLKQHNISLQRQTISTLQVNIGKRCNQACHHCHVESGPQHPDNMNAESIDRLLALLSLAPHIHTVDITGGAPELNPHFKRFVSAIRGMGKHVINRCNLTVLFEEGQADTAEFFAQYAVQIVASLPCYSEANVNAQRGKGVFAKSIQGLQLLNAFGYGQAGSGLILNLVYNPLGAFLPPQQAQLKQDYQKKLYTDFGIRFNDLFTITNMPIKRFAHQLQRDGQWDAYLQLLLDNFNPEAAQSVMCKELISVGFDGQLYDCDFNQMLDMPVAGRRLTIETINSFDEVRSSINIADHCLACTAGSGSSCGGSLT